jgi:hypothetical protein
MLGGTSSRGCQSAGGSHSSTEMMCTRQEMWVWVHSLPLVCLKTMAELNGSMSKRSYLAPGTSPVC